MLLSINCIFSYIDESKNTLVFVPEEDADEQKLLKHKVACNGQFRVKMNKKSGIPNDIRACVGKHGTLYAKCVKYKIKQTNDVATTTHSGNRLIFVNLKCK